MGTSVLKNTNLCEMHEDSCHLNFVPKRSVILVSVLFLRYDKTNFLTVVAIIRSSKNYVFLTIYQTL